MAWIFTTDGNYVNFNGGGNLWRLHKDSACISWHWDESGDLFFDVYDQEYYVKAGNIADVVINGTPLSAASGFPAAIQAVFTGLYSPSGYLEAQLLVSQSGTAAPTIITVVDNTGKTNPSRFGVGKYVIAAGLTIDDTTYGFTPNLIDTTGWISIDGSGNLILEMYFLNGDGTYSAEDGDLIKTPVWFKIKQA